MLSVASSVLVLLKRALSQQRSEIGNAVHRIAMILLVAVSCPLSAAEERNCNPAVGLVDGTCHTEPPRPAWWTCDADTYSTPQERQVTAEQQRRLEDFGLRIFSPALPGYGPQDFRFTRSAVIKRFGHPLSTRSRERLPYDPTDPMEIITTWEFSGFRITTVAGKPHPDVFQLDEGEAFDAKVPLRHGVRIGQSIDRWTRQFGRPNCSRGHPVYDGEYYFACGKNKDVSCVATYQIELFVDGAGKVQRMKWSHPML
jgi:hypothetical protein